MAAVGGARRDGRCEGGPVRTRRMMPRQHIGQVRQFGIDDIVKRVCGPGVPRSRL